MRSFRLGALCLVLLLSSSPSSEAKAVQKEEQDNAKESIIAASSRYECYMKQSTPKVV